MKRILWIIVFIIGYFTSTAQQYVNGNLTTGATASDAASTAAPTGFTWSEVQAGNTTLGNSAAISLGYSLADDFTISSGNWTISKLTFFAYSTGYTGTTSPFTTLRIKIYDTDPSVGNPTPVFGDTLTNRLTASSSANMYRIGNATPGTTRQIWKLEAAITPISLPAGTYWIEWQTGVTTGVTSNFTPPSTVVGTTTQPGNNAKQHNIWQATWIDVADGGGLGAPDFNFIIDYPSPNCTGTFNSSTQSSCNSYTWHGTTYTASGNYTYSYSNNNSCASVDTLHLTINTGTFNSTTQSACNSYTWHGTTYTTSGNYTYSYNNNNSCLSVDTLHLNIIANIVTQPTNTSVCSGSNLSFTTEVSSIYPITYQWQESNDNGASFYDIFDNSQFVGTNTNSLSILNATNLLNGRKYRANIFVNGYSGATNSALLTVNELPVLQLTASANNVCSGASVSLSASGASTYSWTPGNFTGSTITVTPPINTNNPQQPNITAYKVVGTTNLGCVDSTFINITANTIRSIVTQPKNDTVTCSSFAFFSIKISGDFDSLIQWQEKRTPSGNWTNLSNNAVYSGVNKSNLIISTVTDAMNGYQYRVYFTGTCSAAVYSNTATLVVNKLNAIVNPNQAKICSGNSQKFEIQNIYEPVKTRTFSSGTLNTIIPDGDYNGILIDPIFVHDIPDTAEIVDVSIKFNLPHTRVGDIDINLLSPNGQVLNLVGELSNGNGNNTSDNFTNTIISSSSTNSISNAPAPRTGTYAAEKRAYYGGQIYQIDNINWSDMISIINGGWQLAIDDWNFGDTGYLANWSISITYKNPSDHTPATGTWSPITSLYKDSALLVPYTGGATNVVYAKYPTANINYNVVVQTQNCTTNTNVIPVIKALTVTGVTTPSDITICEGGDTVQFVSNAVSGTVLNYQWQVSSDNGGIYSNVVDDGVSYFGANSNTLKIVGYNGGFDGNKYRMVIEACGDTIYSDPGTLNVYANPNAKILIDDATPICSGQPVLLHSSINNYRNSYDGIYQLIFSNYHPIYNINYDGGNTKVEMRSSGENSVKIYWPNFFGYYNPAILNGYLTTFTRQEPEYTIDPVSKKITVQNSYSGAVTFYSMAPNYDSYFDPADNSLYAKWGYGYVDGLFDPSTSREWTQQFIYLKPRPTYQYQWKFNGVNITGATDSVYLATIPGLYTLSITTSEGCSFTSAAVDTKIHKEITANGSTLLCNGSSVNISVSSLGNTYQWFKNDTAISGANDYVYAVSEPGVYYATFNDNLYGCGVVSDSIAIGTIFALSNSPVMTGDNIILSASSIPNATYSWTGPNGYSASTQNPIISNAQLSMSGTYSVIANVSGCNTLTYNVDVVVVSPTKTYTFTGNGNWSLATNWASFLKPPATLPSGSQIIINPTSNGECILNITQTISQGASIKVLTGKKFRVPGNLIVQ